VIARNTAFTYKGKPVDAKEIGKGSAFAMCSRLGPARRERVRSMRSSSTPIPARTFGRQIHEDLADLFKLQDQVVARLANAWVMN